MLKIRPDLFGQTGLPEWIDVSKLARALADRIDREMEERIWLEVSSTLAGRPQTYTIEPCANIKKGQP